MALQIHRRHRCYMPNGIPNGILSVVFVDGDSSRFGRDTRLVLAEEGTLPSWLIEDLIVALTGTMGELKTLYRATHSPYRDNSLTAYTRLTASGFLSDYRLVLERIFQLRWDREIFQYISSAEYRERTRHIRVRLRHEPA